MNKTTHSSGNLQQNFDNNILKPNKFTNFISGRQRSTPSVLVNAEDVQDLVRNEQSFDVATNRALCDATFQAFKRKLDKTNPGYDQ